VTGAPAGDLADPGDVYEGSPVAEGRLNYAEECQVVKYCHNPRMPGEPHCAGHAPPELHPIHTEQERPVSHKITVTVTDEAHAALVAAAKKDESVQDTIRRLLHRSLKLPKPGK